MRIFLLNALNATPNTPLPTTIVTTDITKTKTNSKPPSSSDKIKQANVILMGDRSNSHTKPFLQNFKNFNKNVHNCLVNFSASCNKMPYSICQKLNIIPHESTTQIIQLDISKVIVLGEINEVLIRLSCQPKVFQILMF